MTIDPDFNLEQQLARLEQEALARETSRTAIAETRARAVETQEIVGLLKFLLDGARSKTEQLEEKVRQTEEAVMREAGALGSRVGLTEAVARRTERKAVVAAWAVGGLAVVTVLLAVVILAFTRSTAHAQGELMTKLAEIEKRGVVLSVAQYESRSFVSGASVCNQSDTRDPCGFLCEIPVDGTKRSGECESMREIAAKNLDTAFVIATGGHDVQRLGSSLVKTYDTNPELAKARAVAVSDAFRSALDEARRGQTDRPHPFPLTRYTRLARTAEHEGAPVAEDRTVILTLVHARTSP
jgi:hypothetical protein